MNEFNRKSHLECPNYDLSNYPIIDVIYAEKGTNLEEFSLINTVVLLLSGEIEISFGINISYFLVGGKMFYLPSGLLLTIHARSDSQIMIIRCDFKLENCKIEISSFKHKILSKKDLILSNSSFKSTLNQDFTLTIDQSINFYANQLKECLERGLKCRIYMKNKAKEFFHLLKAFYSKEQIEMFFNGEIAPTSDFIHFITSNYHNYHSLNDMATDLNMTVSGFEKRFKKIFGISPYRWLTNKKAQSIYYALTTEESPLKEISARFGFSSITVFNDFCKNKFGLTPAQIRQSDFLAQKTNR